MPDNPTEAGPNLSTFGGGAAAASGIFGTNQLQQALDSLTQAVKANTDATQKVSQAQQQGGITSSHIGQFTGSFPKTFNPYIKTNAEEGLRQGNAGPATMAAGFSPTMNQVAANIGGGAGQNNGQGFGQMISNAMGGPPSGGGGRGQAGATGGGIPAGPTIGGMLGSAAGSVWGMLAGTGRARMQSAITANTFAFQSGQLGAGGNPQAFYNSFAGSPNGGSRNATVFSYQDAVQQAAYAQGITGQAYPFAGSQGQMLRGGLGMLSYGSPLSGAQQAQQLAQNYLPSTSMNLMMRGFPTWALPRQPGTGAMRPLATTFAGMLARASQFTPGAQGGMTGNQIRGAFANGGALQMLAQQVGYNPQAIQNQVLMENALMTGRNVNNNRMVLGATNQFRNNPQAVQNLFSQMQHGTQAQQNQDEQLLQRLGFGVSDIQRLKQNQGATSAQRGAELQTGFDTGLKNASDLLGQFNTALNNAINTLHLGFGMGAGQGFAGTMHGMANLGMGAGVAGLGFGLGKSLIGSILGKGAGGAASKLLTGGGGRGAGGILSKLLGGGGAGEAGAAGGAGEAGAAGGAGLAALGPLALALGGTGLASTMMARQGHAGMGGSGFLSGIEDYFKLIGKNPLGSLKKTGTGIWHDITNIFGGGAAVPQTGLTATTAQGGRPTASTTGAISSKVQKAVKLAESQKGVPYAYGKETPGVGFDCSGLVQWAYQMAGVYLPRTAIQQQQYLAKNTISPRKVMEGDIVFQAGAGRQAHEALLVNNGKQIIEAPGTGQTVRIRDYNPSEWRIAARPVQSAANTGAGRAGNSNTGSQSNAKPGTNTTSGGALSGFANPLRSISGLTPQRIDQGVDYAGSGPIYAIGPGTITETTNSGWPGGAYIEEKLSSGYPGKFWFFAEDITPTVHVGQAVTDQTVIGQMHGSIETGWGAGNGGNALAGVSNQFTGNNSTAYGQNASQFLKSLGAPGGILQGKVSGTVGAGFFGGPTSGGTSSGSNAPSGSGPTTQPFIPGASGFGNGLGDFTNMGSTSEAQAFLGGVTGQASNVAGSMMQANNNQQNNAGSTTTPSSAPAGSGAIGIGPLTKYLESAGYSKAAAAGMAGVAGGEGTGANPEVVGSGGAGLIGWTPPSAMIPYGGTCAAVGIGHNSPTVDMQNQEKAMVKWATANGFPPPQNRFPNTLQGAMQAAYAASAAYERPAVPGSDVHSQLIAQAWAAAAKGGTFLVGERGRELVNVSTAAGGTQVNITPNDQTERLLGNAVQQTAQSPFMAGAPGSWNYSPVNNLYQGAMASSRNGCTVNIGDIVINMPPAPADATGPMSGYSARQIGKQVLSYIQQELTDNQIALGVNS